MTPREPLHFRLLGELELRRGERLLELPASKKTRALLAYLALTQRAHRRDQLCRLFWDVTDDPRGALRWSLSKLRAVFQAEDPSPIVADRDHVRFVAPGAQVDLLDLRTAVSGRTPTELGTELLEQLAGAWRGAPLEGLDLPDFDDYQAWCVAEREAARLAQAAVSAELVRRHREQPQHALEFARAWAQLDPMNEAARAALVTLLGTIGHFDEARQHYESGLRLEQELGRRGGGELREAWRALERTPPRAAPAGARLANPPALTAARAGDHEPTAPRFVGRESEHALLDATLERCRAARRVQVLVLSGEPGSGKTRLLRDWCRRLGDAGSRALYAAAFEAESGHPYGPWLDALRDVETGRLAPGPLLDLLRGAFEGEASDPRGRERLFGAVADAVSALSAVQGGLVLVLDDVQWLDASSAELLHYVLRMNRHRELMLVLLGRAGELADNAALLRVLRSLRREGLVLDQALGPLARGALEQLARSVRPDADTERIATESAGNPLFAIELARAEAGSVPSSLSDLVRDRLAQLPPAAADVLRWGAVLGCGFSLRQLDGLMSLSPDTVVETLELLERRALLVRERSDAGSYAFAHEIMRRLVYADLSEPRRRLMHRRVAELLAGLEEGTPASVRAADVAHHAALADDAALAAEACLSAGRRSLRLFANADAHALARRGLRHAERLEEPARTRRAIELWELSLSARAPEEPAHAAQQLEMLAERALDLGCMEQARLGFHLLSYLRFESGQFAAARKQMLQAELVSRGSSERERVVGMAEAARCLVLLERDLGHAQALALEAAARARNAGVESSAVFGALGMLGLHQGRLNEAADELERARELAHVSRERHDEFQALEHLVMLELERRDWAAAQARAVELSELSEKFRGGSEAPFARALLALCRLQAGDDAADPELEDALAALTLADAKHRLGFVLTRAAQRDLERGLFERACARAQRALDIAELLDRTTERAIARLVLAGCAQARGDRPAARAQWAALSESELAWMAQGPRAQVQAQLARADVRATRGGK